MSYTHFALLAKYGDANIPLAACCETFFGMSVRTASDAAKTNQLPIPVYRLGHQKSQWFIDAKILADYIDRKKQESMREWERVNCSTH